MVSQQSTWYCGNEISVSFLYQCVVRYDRWHVDWSRYLSRFYDGTKLPICRLFAVLSTRTTRGCIFGYRDCSVLSAWRNSQSYPTCDATSQWHSLIGGLDEVTGISRRNPVRCLCMELGEEWSVQKKSVYTRQIAWSDNGGYRAHKGTSSCTQTSYAPCPHEL